MIRALFSALLLALVLTQPAAAHKLKLFATVEGNTIAGYAFFVGGGRAQGTHWVAKNANGDELATGETGSQGEFSFIVPLPLASDVTVSVDTREGHIATRTLAAARFGDEPDLSAETGSAANAAQPGEPASAALSNAQVATLVETAVQRQVEPLLERIEEMDSRLRFTDILSGIFLIVGLAGIGLWARGRRK